MTYTTRTRYTPEQLARYYLLDLIVDIRCARRDGHEAYAQDQVAEFRRVWKIRHAPAIDRYGIPIERRQS